MTEETRKIKLTEIEDKKSFLYRIAKAMLDAHGEYFCILEGERVEIVK